MTDEQSPEQIERGLPYGARFSLARSRNGTVSAESGDGHTLNALSRRGLVPPRDQLYPTWNGHQWVQRLTPLGREVAALARTSTRPGGGREKRGTP